MRQALPPTRLPAGAHLAPGSSAAATNRGGKVGYQPLAACGERLSAWVPKLRSPCKHVGSASGLATDRVRAPHRLNRESRRHDPARAVPSTRGEQPAPTGADANRPAPDDACTPPTTAVLAGSRLLASRGLLLFLRLCWSGGLLRGANRFRSFGRHPLLLWLRGLLSMPFYVAAGAPSTAGMLKPIRLCLGSAVRTLLLIRARASS